jgi:hypothetical protein
MEFLEPSAKAQKNEKDMASSRKRTQKICKKLKRGLLRIATNSGMRRVTAPFLRLSAAAGSKRGYAGAGLA